LPFKPQQIVGTGFCQLAAVTVFFPDSVTSAVLSICRTLIGESENNRFINSCRGELERYLLMGTGYSPMQYGQSDTSEL
jgi:hypothetical protein